MNPEQIIGQLLGGFLGGKKKRKRGGFGLPGLGGYGGGSRSSGGGLINAGTLLTVGGLIWGALETMQQGSGPGATGPGAPPPSGPPAPRHGRARSRA